MNRFLSNATNRVDRKGRVSIPAPFRVILNKTDGRELYTLLSIDLPTADAGGTNLLEAFENRLADFDPLTSQYDDLSIYYHGDSAFLKIDTDGRIMLSQQILDHTGIGSEVTFVGRGTHFQIWAPEKFHAHRLAVRQRLLEIKQNAIAGKTGVPE